MSEDEIALLIATLAVYLISERNEVSRAKRNKRRIAAARRRVHRMYSAEKSSLGAIFCRKYQWMDGAAYNKLLEMITPMIRKRDTFMKRAITPDARLNATLQYLANGCTYVDLKLSTGISATALGQIIPDTCRAIVRCLRAYAKMPNTSEEWSTIARAFTDRWDFPHCVGVVDGRHIKIVPPAGSGSLFYNYKQFHSIVLMACVNANHEFIWVEVGTKGEVSDGTALKYTQFIEQLYDDKLDLPPPQPVLIDGAPVPYVFVVDEKFDLIDDFINPFTQHSLTDEQKIYNDRLIRPSSVAESVFNVIANRFRVLQTTINLTLDRINIVVLACCALHNFLKRTCCAYTVQTTLSEHELEHGSAGDPLTPLQNTASKISSETAESTREMFKQYLSVSHNSERRLI